jgi:hypothetical protein
MTSGSGSLRDTVLTGSAGVLARKLFRHPVAIAGSVLGRNRPSRFFKHPVAIAPGSVLEGVLARKLFRRPVAIARFCTGKASLHRFFNIRSRRSSKKPH